MKQVKKIARIIQIIQLIAAVIAGFLLVRGVHTVFTLMKEGPSR